MNGEQLILMMNSTDVIDETNAQNWFFGWSGYLFALSRQGTMPRVAQKLSEFFDSENQATASLVRSLVSQSSIGGGYALHQGTAGTYRTVGKKPELAVFAAQDIRYVTY